MGLFGRKKGVEIDELCARYYQFEVFNNPEYYDIAFSYIAENCDASTMNKKLVENELIALRMELFGLVLSKSKRERGKHGNADTWNPQTWNAMTKALSTEITFTKNYLTSTKKENVWKTMGVYNQAIADVIYQKRLGLLASLLTCFPTMLNNDALSANRSMIREFNKKIFYSGLKKAIPDAELCNRVVNRIGSDEEDWDEESQSLSIKLAGQLGYIDNLDYLGMCRFQQLVYSLYRNVKEFIWKSESPRVFLKRFS